ncbi:hypothetical protein FRC04_005288 [Tulasnella sp. 424]|nr:hypothetical protein FRC04_005288 [Tulasnella sp. 424]KAG8976400.1 hypothetical protein FRC05_003643 [Tulasnella sp. 425]
MAVSTPVIISVTIGAVLVLSVALVTIVRWASTKPSTQLPPPRSAALLSPYWANQQRYSTHFGGPVDIYEEERKLTGKGSGVFNPYVDYSTSNVSDSSLYRGTKTPDGDRTPNSGVSFGHENVGPQSEQHHLTPPLQPNELGEISLNSPNPPRQRPTSLQFVNGSPVVRPPAGNFGPNGSTTTVGGGAPQAAATDPQQNALPPSAFSHMHPSPPRPFSTSSRSRHSIAGPPPPIAQPPPSFYQTKQDRRASRMSMLSTYSSSGYTYDPRRSSVTSMIRGPPHKSNMQIVLPAPLAATAASGPGIGFPGNNIGNAHDAEDSAFRRNQRRHSRVDLWTETNNIARSKSPLADFSAAADSGSRSNRRPSLGSEKSGRSLELANSGQFMHMQPPPPLPAASSRSLLTSSPTPNSSSSALPPMSSAMTTPQLSTEIVHEKHASSSDAHSTSTSNNAVPVDDSKPPPPPQPQNVVKSDNLPSIPSLPAIEPTKDI